MPKETIAPHVFGDDQHQAPFVQVGWQRDLGLVQLATLEGGDHRDLAVERAGFYASLDRHGINHLIRVLRRARDQACGADA